MKLMIAQAACVDPELADGLEAFLRAEKFEVERLHLTPIDDARPMQSIAYWRLLPVATATDVLLCLDPLSALLGHSRKCVCLLGGIEQLFEGSSSYLANVIWAGLHEAKAVFASSETAERLKTSRLSQLTRVDIAEVSADANFGRFKGRAQLLKALAS